MQLTSIFPLRLALLSAPGIGRLCPLPCWSMLPMLWWPMLCWLMLIPQGQAAESRILFSNGDQLTGTVISETADQLQLQTAYAGLIWLDRHQISQITPLSVEAATAANQQNLSDIPDQDTAAKVWSLELDASASSRHGKADSSVLDLTLAAGYQQPTWRAALDSHFDYELKDQTRKTHQYDISPSLDYFINPRLFWRTSVDYHYNYLASDYRNLDFSTGPGYALWQGPQLKLDVIAAAGVKKAYFRHDDVLSRLINNRTQLDYRISTLEWELSWQFQPWPLEFYSDGNWMHLLDQPLPYLYFDREIVSNLGLRYRLTDQIRLSWSYSYSQTDLELRLPGLSGQSFDIKDYRQKLSIGATF